MRSSILGTNPNDVEIQIGNVPCLVLTQVPDKITCRLEIRNVSTTSASTNPTGKYSKRTQFRKM